MPLPLLLVPLKKTTIVPVERSATGTQGRRAFWARRDTGRAADSRHYPIVPPAVSDYGRLVLIRDVTERDWPAVYKIFTAVVQEGRTYAYPEDLASDAARDLWLIHEPGRTVVAVDGDVVLGTATMTTNRPGRGSHIATGSFMVSPAERRRGVGRALGQYVVEWATEAGYRGIQFNAVVENNRAAVSLWQSLGFDIIGTVPGAFRHADGGFVGLHVMFRPIG